MKLRYSYNCKEYFVNVDENNYLDIREDIIKNVGEDVIDDIEFDIVKIGDDEFCDDLEYHLKDETVNMNQIESVLFDLLDLTDNQLACFCYLVYNFIDIDEAFSKASNNQVFYVKCENVEDVEDYAREYYSDICGNNIDIIYNYMDWEQFGKDILNSYEEFSFNDETYYFEYL